MLATLRQLAGSFWIRLLVSVVLLAVVATQIDFHALRDRLSGGSWGWFAAATALLLASFVVGALRWHILLAAANVGSGRGQAIRAYLIGAFTTDVGALSTYTHIWGYASYADREERRARLQADERWRTFLAKIQPLIHTQQNRILLPTAFSPIR